MSLRTPPGRAGRMWLLRRIAVGRRGRDVLEQKRRALLLEAERLRGRRDEARVAWEESAREAEQWWRRASVLAGQRPLRITVALVPEPAELTVRRRSSLGVTLPADPELRLPPPASSARGSSALAFAATAHRRALDAAATLAVAERAYAATVAEAAATGQRLRAIDCRWLPEHEQALERLELELDEVDREDAARVRWVIRRHESRR